MTVVESFSGEQVGGSLKPRMVVLLLGEISLMASDGAPPKREDPCNDATSDERYVSQHIGWGVVANPAVPPVRSGHSRERDDRKRKSHDPEGAISHEL